MPTIKDSSSIEEVLQYIVACYGVAIYQEKQRLSNLIADLYTGEERLKRLYRRMVMEDAVSQQLYAIYLKPIQEREGFYNRLVTTFLKYHHKYNYININSNHFANNLNDSMEIFYQTSSIVFFSQEEQPAINSFPLCFFDYLCRR